MCETLKKKHRRFHASLQPPPSHLPPLRSKPAPVPLRCYTCTGKFWKAVSLTISFHQRHESQERHVRKKSRMACGMCHTGERLCTVTRTESLRSSIIFLWLFSRSSTNDNSFSYSTHFEHCDRGGLTERLTTNGCRGVRADVTVVAGWAHRRVRGRALNDHSLWTVRRADFARIH